MLPSSDWTPSPLIGDDVGIDCDDRNTAAIHYNRICKIDDDLDWSNDDGVAQP